MSHILDHELTVKDTAAALGVTPEHVRSGYYDAFLTPRVAPSLSGKRTRRYYGVERVRELVERRSQLAAMRAELKGGPR